MKRSGILRIAAVLLISAAALVFIYHCPFRYFFGVSCPGCGMTRALFAAVFSDFETAFQYHPLLPLIAVAGLYILLQKFCGMYVPSRRQNVYILLLALVMILVYIVRLFSGDPIIAPDFEASAVSRVLHFLQDLRS